MSSSRPAQIVQLIQTILVQILYAQSLLEKRQFHFIICLLKINHEEDSIHFLLDVHGWFHATPPHPLSYDDQA
jgi:hypothetical protein